ncbi:lipase 1 isoform X2 [Carex rostrata]
MGADLPVTKLLPLLYLLFLFAHASCSHFEALRRSSPNYAAGLCDLLLLPLGYPCTEHTVETKDGFILSVQNIPYGKNALRKKRGPPVYLQHGLFQGGDAWFINSCEQSLGYILADNGFDVWVGNVRGTRWSKNHASYNVHDKEFWDWSWQELAQYDLLATLSYINLETQSKVIYVGHSQMLEIMGIHQLNFRSNMGVQILDSLCDDEHIDCSNLLSSITGSNCCFNSSRVEYYLEYEPHPSSTKNLRHLFQMIRKGTFAKYDYGWWGNLQRYGASHPPSFDLNDIPDSLPLWIGYGGLDALADVTDVKHTLSELRSEPELLYLDNYGHIDFILSPKASGDVYGDLIRFLKSTIGTRSSS